MDLMGKEKVNINFLFQEKRLVEVKYNFANLVVKYILNSARKAVFLVYF